MSDFIRREDAIEAVCRTRCRDKAKGCPAHSCIVIEEFDALPSADTDMSEYCDRLWKIAYERGKAEAVQHNKDAISREGLLKSWEELSPRGRLEFDQVIMTIPALPSAEPKTGEWKPKNHHTDYCSNCGFEETQWRTADYNFCPSCGARMKGVDDEHTV